MDSPHPQALLDLRFHLDEGHEEEVRTLLWQMADEFGLKNRKSWQPSRILSAQLHGLVTSWRWPEVAWSNTDVPARMAWIEAWNAEHPGKSALEISQRAEQALRAMMEVFPGNLFEVVGDHLAWRHMRTSSSNGQNNILHLMARGARDTLWLEGVLSKYGDWLRKFAPEGTSPAWKGCLDRGSEPAKEYLSLFHRYGHIDLTKDSQDVPKIMRALAERGMISQILWVQSISGTARVPGVEQELAGHKKLEGKKSSEVLGPALERLEHLWGPLNQDEMVGVWRKALSHHTLGRTGATFRSVHLTAAYEERLVAQGWWDHTLAGHALDMCVAAKRADVLASYIQRGFTFLPEDVERARIEADKPIEAWESPNLEVSALLRSMSLLNMVETRPAQRARMAM